MLEFLGPVQSIVYWGLALTSLGLKGYAFIDAIRRPSEAFPYAGKKTKQIWLAITGVALAVNVVILNPLGLLNIAGVVAAIVYLVDVRPAVSQYRAGGGQSYGPYGPYR